MEASGRSKAWSPEGVLSPRGASSFYDLRPFQSCRLADGAQVLHHQPLLDARGVVLVTAIQGSYEFSRLILLLHGTEQTHFRNKKRILAAKLYYLII